jgi:hypothetical protein
MLGPEPGPFHGEVSGKSLRGTPERRETMHLHPATRAKLEHDKGLLVNEFRSVPREEISRKLDVVAGRLLSRANFDDFIPALAFRFTREDLNDRRRFTHSRAA